MFSHTASTPTRGARPGSPARMATAARSATAVWAILAACAATLSGPAASPLAAQDDSLRRYLVEHRYRVTLSGDTLAGAGARLLNEEGRAARYALVGEEHGTAEIPAFTAAWFRGIIPAGYRYLAVEVGPETGRLLDSLAALGIEALRDFQAAHPPGFPFFVQTEEARLLVEARRALPDRERVIWGIDYDILGDRYLFDALEAAAPDEASRAIVREIRQEADRGLETIVGTGDPSRLLLWSSPDETFQRLRRAIDPDPGSLADAILETMRETAAINRLFLGGSNFESNRRRAAWLKRSTARQIDGARTRTGREPRVLVKLGANHVYRGLNVTRQYDVGAMLAQLAAADGERSFHLYAMGGPGSQVSGFNPVEMGYETRPATAFGGLPASDAFAEALFEEGWTLFDLRPLRPAIHERRIPADQALLDLVFNFDGLLVVPDASAAETLIDPGAALRGTADGDHR